MTYQAGDLQDLIDPIFEVDAFKSKMGDDEDIVVVSFTVNETNAAKDLVDFIEKGYDFVLDADSTPGEIDNGKYKVFVEIERNKGVAENIMELLDGVGKISFVQNFRYRYHKGFQSKDATVENLGNIPTDTTAYLNSINENTMDNYKNFFSKSFLESSELLGNNLYVKKAYADPVGFVIKDFSNTKTINEGLEEKINVNDYAEIMFLTKYIGDYNIMKFGEKTLTFENQGYTLVAERM